MGQGVRIVSRIIGILIIVTAAMYGMMMLIVGGNKQLLNQDNYMTVVHMDSYLGNKLCDKKIATYYDQLLLCLQSISNLDLLDINDSEDVIKVNGCDTQASQGDQMAYCFSYSNYRYLIPVCSMIVNSQQYKNSILRGISEILCIKEHESLISSGDATLNFRRQFDGSSFIMCSKNSDCSDDEFCSVQGVQRCEKIVGVYRGAAILVNARQMEDIIKDKTHKIVGGGDSHSHINSVSLDNGKIYVARDVSVLGLVDKYYSQEDRSKMELWIE